MTKSHEIGFNVEVNGVEYTIERDVCHEHPAEVHVALGSSSESELQAMLDGLYYRDWFADDGSYLGRDCNGVGLSDEPSKILIDRGAAVFITCRRRPQ